MTKLYYSIKEISDLVDEEQHILRYWEKEFTILKPKKNKAGNRTYTHKDLLIILKIKSMIREEHLSLKEAKEKFKSIKINDLLEESDETSKLIDVKDSKNNFDTESVEETEINKIELVILKEDEKRVFEKEEIEIEVENLDKHLITEEIKVENYININDEIIELEKNEDTIDFSFDKKIILKNHLFEDYEEFSVFDADKYNEIKNSKSQKEKEDQNKVVDFNYEQNENNLKNNIDEDGIVLSYDSLKSLIFILKEIKQLIIK